MSKNYKQNNEGQFDDGDGNGAPCCHKLSPNHFAAMPVDRNASYFNMNHKKRGEALIFNHEHFDNQTPRPGTNIDCDSLDKVLKQLGFHVTIFHDLKAMDIHKQIQQTAKMDHTQNDCLLVAVLSHGGLGMLYAKDTHYIPENLWYPFTADKCPTLAGKPKIFFIQACQGDKLDGGITLVKHTETDGVSTTAYRIPTHADFLIVYSTIPGYYSWRNPSEGSCFIQALCEKLYDYGEDMDILTLLTFVCHKIALDFESYAPSSLSMHQKKQVPCITSMLTRLLVLGKKI